MARALQFANRKLDEIKGENRRLLADNAIKTQQIAELTPKASYYDVVLSCTDLVPITLIAKDACVIIEITRKGPFASEPKDALEVFEKCDGLLMTGGHDVSPSLYKKQRGIKYGASCKERDLVETALYMNAMEQDKPILGICRGIQLINVLQGGTLYQDLPTEYASGIEHHMEPPYTNAAHFVKKETPLII